MPRMRTLKPEAATSETLAQVDPSVRWTFAMLWTYQDDEGRGVINPRLIKAAIYPLDDDITPEVVERHLKELERVGAVCFYNVDGKSYVHVPAWGEHQHPNRKVESKLPPCPELDHSPTAQAQRTANALSETGALTPVVVVEGRVDVDGDVGEASRTTAMHNPGSTVPAEAVRAYVQACPEPPAKTLQARIEKQARALITEGHAPDKVLTAAASAGRAGWHDLAIQMQRDAARASPSADRPATSDVRAASAIQAGRAVKAQLEERKALG